MHKPASYEKHHRHEEMVREILHEFKFDWRADGADSLMDVGCGSGDVTIKLILPLLPSNFKHLIGIDVSRKMISYAQENYSRPNIEFKVFDIGVGDSDQFPQVDHITSILCLHWVKKDHQKAIIQNIYNLLKPGGDCLLWLGTRGQCYHAYELMAATEKWTKYMDGVDDFVPPYQNQKNPELDFERRLEECKFSSFHVEARKYNFKHDNVNQYKKLLLSVDPFYERIPIDQQDDYFNELISLTCDSTEVSSKDPVDIYLDTIVAYAKK